MPGSKGVALTAAPLLGQYIAAQWAGAARPLAPELVAVVEPALAALG